MAKIAINRNKSTLRFNAVLHEKQRLTQTSRMLLSKSRSNALSIQALNPHEKTPPKLKEHTAPKKTQAQKKEKSKLIPTHRTVGGEKESRFTTPLNHIEMSRN